MTRRVITVLSAAGVMLAALLYALSPATWVLPSALACCIYIALASRMGWLTALVITASGMPLLAVLFAALAWVLGAGLEITLFALAACVLIVLLGSLLRGDSLRLATPNRAALESLIAPGAVVVTVFALIAFPGAAWRSAFMAGDSSNNVLFALDLVNAGGLNVLGDNPVPATHAILAWFMAGADQQEFQTATSVYLTAHAAVWLLALTFASVLSSVLATSLQRRLGSPSLFARHGVSLAAAIVPWGYPVAGVATPLGHLNSVLVLIVVLGTAIACTQFEHRQASSFAAVCLGAASLVVLWTPLLVFSASVLLALAALLIKRRGIAAAWPVFMWLAVPAVVCLVMIVPRLSAAGGAGGLAADGGITYIAITSVIGFALASVTLCLLPTAIRSAYPTLWVVPVGLILTVLATFAIASQWSYYPQKAAWTLVMVATVLVLSLLAGIGQASRLGRLRRAWTVASVMVGFAAFSLTTVQAAIEGRFELPRGPLATIALGIVNGEGDRLAREVVTQSYEDRIVATVGAPGSVELEASFWRINLASAAFDPEAERDQRFDLRLSGYLWLQSDPSAACALVDAAPGGVVIIGQTQAPTSNCS